MVNKVASILLLILLLTGCRTVPIAAKGKGIPNDISSYDQKVVATIKSHWEDAIPSKHPPQTARVEVWFVLYADGKISDLKVTYSDASDSLTQACKKAILSSAPFDRWPNDLIQICTTEKGTSREVTFTFNYE